MPASYRDSQDPTGVSDSRESPVFIETVPGKGYRFVAPVEVVSGSNPQASPGLQAAHDRLPGTRRNNLTAELTSFVGRQRELAELPQLLRSARLLSLTGVGGVGKTRLAIRLGFDLVNEFPDGVWLVDLAPLSAPNLVAQTIAIAVGVREGPQRSARDALLENLRNRELLLVLDNCEHLIGACAELADFCAEHRRCGLSQPAAKRWECAARPSAACRRYRCRKRRGPCPPRR
jgi:hypothetical protein